MVDRCRGSVLRDLARSADVAAAGPWAAAADLARWVCDLGPRAAVVKLGSLGALGPADGPV